MPDCVANDLCQASIVCTGHGGFGLIAADFHVNIRTRVPQGRLPSDGLYEAFVRLFDRHARHVRFEGARGRHLDLDVDSLKRLCFRQ